MRLFVAAVPPAQVADDLAAAVAPVRDDVLRWTGTEAWHVTLAFYGEIGLDRVDELRARLARAGRRHPPPMLHLAGAGRFGSTVLWVGVAGDLPVLRRHARSLAAAGRRVGAQPDQHERFRPHVTLARARQPTDLRPYASRLNGYSGPSWIAAEVALISSRPDHRPGKAPHYEVLDTFPLDGVTPPPPPRR